MHFRKLFPIVAFVALLFSALTLQAEESQVGSAAVKSRPEGGVVFMDGLQVGVTPCTVENVAIGTHRIVVRMDGYKLYAGNLTVSAGQKAVLRAELESEAAESEADDRRKVEGIVQSSYFKDLRFYAGYSWNRGSGNYKTKDISLGMVYRRFNVELDYLTPNGTIDCGGNYLPTHDRSDLWKHYHEFKHGVTGRVGVVMGQSKRVDFITQVGFTDVKVDGFQCAYQSSPAQSDYGTAHLQGALAAFRLDYMCTKWLSLNCVGEFDFRLGQDESIDVLIKKASVAMNDWISGLRFKIGASIVL